MEMSLLRENGAGRAALGWGLINRVVDDEQLYSEVGRSWSDWRRSHAVLRGQAADQRPRLHRDRGAADLEATIQQEQAATSDFVEGVAAFVERR